MSTSRSASAAVAIDKATVSVLRGVGPRHGPVLKAMADDIGLRSVPPVLDVLEYLVCGRLTETVIRLRGRYRLPSSLDSSWHELKLVGLVDEHLAPSPALRRFVLAATEARAETARWLWEGHELDRVDVGARQALAAAGGSLTRTFVQLPEPSGGAARLLHRFIGLRYARMDAHVEAWTNAGVDFEEILFLTDVWSGQKVSDAAPARLIERRWVDGSGAITELGRSARDKIESDTNELSDTFFEAVDPFFDWLGRVEQLGRGRQV